MQNCSSRELLRHVVMCKFPIVVSNTVVMADEEEELVDEDLMCTPGKHKWKQDQCMVCTNCGECTGYGSSCVNSGVEPRNPGM